MTARDALLCAIVAAIYLLLAIPAFLGLGNADLMAPWAAAMAWTDGAGPAIYQAGDQPFDTLATAPLDDAFDALAYTDPRFAYIYPPLWLALLGPVTETISYPVFLAAATWANNLMMIAIVWLAWRASRPTIAAPLFLAVGLAGLALTQVGGLALFYNQVQITVSFLVVLAAERTQARAPVAAGIALALAASLKGYPVLLALIWIGLRDWRALLSFIIAGAALALTSVLLTGWEMHRAFLGQLLQVGRTAFLTPITFNLPALLVQLTMVDQLSPVSYGPEHSSRILVGWQPSWMRVLSGLGLVAVLAGTTWVARQRDVLVWALAAGAISMLTAVAWSHHYVVTLAFVPAIIGRLGWVRGGTLVAVGLAMISYPAVPLWRSILDAYAPLQIAGTLSIMLLLGGLASSARASPD